MDTVPQKSIFIIDDDHDTRVTLRRCFEQKGYFVISAANKSDALSLLQNVTSPSLIILNTSMSTLNGCDFLAVIKSDTTLKSIPIMQISLANAPRAEGTCCALEKPFNLDDVLGLIEDCFQA